MQHTPRRRFGQNFLVDSQTVTDIVHALHPRREDVMVEIGPGLGALTQPLLQSLEHLHVVEIDRDIVKRLRDEFSAKRLIIHEGDALEFDFSSLGGSLRVVGNLPYNISTPLLFHLSRFTDHIRDMHFMLQKEVVARMVAKPSTSDYGRLSVMLQCRFEMEQLFIVPPECFHPPPKVQSAVVRMIPLKKPLIEASQEKLFAEIVSAAFSQRRKTLRNTLRDYLTGEDYLKLEIDSNLRAENLSITQYVAITNYFNRVRSG
ncbi:16S rRNA (adenine(1518)-N(6)/adenine(1519)-N(6))-dimethyltransferase RsmA [Nitrosospira multiformis]|uniref:16S rRNA (adenine(1518)-N(6)/adenine(1519)-N(6))- dimethyltransferase RsmA n=1 Tax=Nitrosospira multiformis TaxID=1231 RepID=UPI00089B3521|nr:16S rRNA (adenine(1518)-N(6)/adenine(1519)-N(6))-dimethyltransferase RsmA [Nitrosospira multiformis]SDZ73236.1 dimethyladenosine transferase [Nitrosospira multiformis]